MCQFCRRRSATAVASPLPLLTPSLLTLPQERRTFCRAMFRILYSDYRTLRAVHSTAAGKGAGIRRALLHTRTPRPGPRGMHYGILNQQMTRPVDEETRWEILTFQMRRAFRELKETGVYTTAAKVGVKRKYCEHAFEVVNGVRRGRMMMFLCILQGCGPRSIYRLKYNAVCSDVPGRR
jgi:hypothetical protein